MPKESVGMALLSWQRERRAEREEMLRILEAGEGQGEKPI